MSQITKVVQSIGNGGHVYVPKEYIGKKVVVTVQQKNFQEIVEEVMDLLQEHLSHIQGVYLCGSYARSEATIDSDIDILVITDGIVRLKKNIREYEIISGSLEEIKRTIKDNTGIILPLLREAKVIMNESLLLSLQQEKITKHNTRWLLDTTISSLAVVKEWLKDKDVKSIPSLAYSLIMRLRGLKLLHSLITGKPYFNKDLLHYLGQHRITQELYQLYREKRDNKNLSEYDIKISDLEQLHKLTTQYLKEVKGLWERLK